MRVTFQTADGVEVELTADQTIALADQADWIEPGETPRPAA